MLYTQINHTKLGLYATANQIAFVIDLYGYAC